MGSVTPDLISQNSSNQKTKASQLNNLAETIEAKIYEIDTELKNLVSGGIEGSAVQEMANSYLKSRKAISGHVQRFAATAVLLDSSSDAMAEVNTKGQSAAQPK